MRFRYLLLLAPFLTGIAFAQIEGQETRRMQVEDANVEYKFVYPDGFTPGSTYPVLLVLPPGGSNSSDANDVLDAYFRDEARARGWVVVSPLPPIDTATRMRTPYYLGSETLIPSFLDGLAEEVGFEGNKVHVAGVSTGGVGAFRIATLYPERFHSVLVLPGQAREADLERIGVLGDTPVRLYAGENETEADLEAMRATAAALDAAGVPGELVVVPGDGHVIESIGGAELFDWLDQQRP